MTIFKAVDLHDGHRLTRVITPSSPCRELDLRHGIEAHRPVPVWRSSTPAALVRGAVGSSAHPFNPKGTR